MLEHTPFFGVRTQGVGVISRELAQDVGVSGPLIRGSGVNYDVRRAEPYSSYGDFDFVVPVETEGDCYARYRVRMVEFRQSIRIIRQALDGDRKSTRLNSSHLVISYAVFCLKKKK